MTDNGAYVTDYFLETYLGFGWVNLTMDVVSPIQGFYGLDGQKIENRVANVGTLEFTLRNDSSNDGGVDFYYLPSHPDVIHSDWNVGVPIRLRIKYQNDYVQKFYGHIKNFQIDPDNMRIRILAMDWMDYAQSYPLTLITVDSNSDISEAVGKIVNSMSRQPTYRDFDHGEDMFTTVFDTVKSKTTAMNEFAKLALSELGFIYMLPTDTLVVEGRYTRLADEVKEVPADVGFLLMETGEPLLLETGDEIRLDASQPVRIYSLMNSVDLVYGDTIINKVTAKSYPRLVDTTLQTLFSLNTPLRINSSGSLRFTAPYRDPNNQNVQITSASIITPVATTDYLMYSGSVTGSGTNMTGSLTITSYFGSDSGSFVFYNSNPTTAGYITYFQFRGYPIYLYDPLLYTTQNAASIYRYGYNEFNLDQKYQNSFQIVQDIADAILDRYKDPRLDVYEVGFLANTNDLLLSSFLYCDIRDKVYLYDQKSTINNEYFVHSVEYQIYPGGVIDFKWNVVPTITLFPDYFILDTSVLNGSEPLGI